MSMYTTGEIAKLCGVTVRTVQYYDTRGILVPSELTEGGRRLYSEDDLKRMNIICFLRGLGLPIDAISQILSEAESEKVIMLLLKEQENELKEQIDELEQKKNRLDSLIGQLNGLEQLSVQSIGDVAYIMKNNNKLKKIHRNLILAGIPLGILQWTSIILWILKGQWWLFVIWAVIAVPAGIIISRYYFKNVAYICPQCHEVFVPSFKEAFFARHTPKTRKLTCKSCGHHGYCVEVAREDNEHEKA